MRYAFKNPNNVRIINWADVSSWMDLVAVTLQKAFSGLVFPADCCLV